MITRFAIFIQVEDSSVCRLDNSSDFATEIEAENHLNNIIEAFGSDKKYLILKILVFH